MVCWFLPIVRESDSSCYITSKWIGKLRSLLGIILIVDQDVSTEIFICQTFLKMMVFNFWFAGFYGLLGNQLSSQTTQQKQLLFFYPSFFQVLTWFILIFSSYILAKKYGSFHQHFHCTQRVGDKVNTNRSLFWVFFFKLPVVNIASIFLIN